MSGLKRLGCVGCKHLTLDTGSQGYSEYTPGSAGSFDCGRDHWNFGYGEGAVFAHTLYDLISRGFDCKDFEWARDLAEREGVRV